MRGSQEFKLHVPGAPPGRTSISVFEKSIVRISESAVIVIPWAPVTFKDSVIETIVIGILTRRIRSTTVKASISSKPGAKKIHT